MLDPRARDAVAVLCELLSFRKVKRAALASQQARPAIKTGARYFLRA
jgi:hypothetical protein